MPRSPHNENDEMQQLKSSNYYDEELSSFPASNSSPPASNLFCIHPECSGRLKIIPNLSSHIGQHRREGISAIVPAVTENDLRQRLKAMHDKDELMLPRIKTLKESTARVIELLTAYKSILLSSEKEKERKELSDQFFRKYFDENPSAANAASEQVNLFFTVRSDAFLLLSLARTSEENITSPTTTDATSISGSCNSNNVSIVDRIFTESLAQAKAKQRKIEQTKRPIKLGLANWRTTIVALMFVIFSLFEIYTICNQTDALNVFDKIFAVSFLISIPIIIGAWLQTVVIKRKLSILPLAMLFANSMLLSAYFIKRISQETSETMEYKQLDKRTHFFALMIAFSIIALIAILAHIIESSKNCNLPTIDHTLRNIALQLCIEDDAEYEQGEYRELEQRSL